MAVDAYMYFLDYNTKYLESESQVDLSKNAAMKFDHPTLFKLINGAWEGGNKKSLFEVEDYSFDIEQTLNIGSQSTGAGAGRVTFNPFSITRKIDKASPRFFECACSGQPFKEVVLGLRKSAGGPAGGGTSGVLFGGFRFLLVAVKTLAWAHDDESPKETITFEYGGLQVFYGQQDPNGQVKEIPNSGWNRVRNISFPKETDFIQ